MIFTSNFYYAFLFLLVSVPCFSNNCLAQSPLQNAGYYIVRVLLDEIKSDHQQSIEWILSAPAGFIVSFDHNKKQMRYACSLLTIRVERGIFYINDKKLLAKNIIIQSNQGFISFNHRSYQGCFNIVYQNHHFYLINQINLEDYVSCVLHAESWPGWPLEVNKAFAIVCRTYAVSKMRIANKRKQPYQIKSTNIHQTYKGVHCDKTLCDAVQQTQGLILTYKKAPIVAMFDSCCGGVIPAYMDNIDFKRCPYLARTYPCNYCKTCKSYSWIVEYLSSDFEKILSNAGYKIGLIKKVSIITDKAKVVKCIEIQGTKTLQLSGKKIYSLLNKIKSFCMSVELKGEKIIFTGKGLGHHLGICQWGARRMLDFGKTYNAILNFYYPGTMLMALKKPMHNV